MPELADALADVAKSVAKTRLRGGWKKNRAGLAVLFFPLFSRVRSGFAAGYHTLGGLWIS
jgi:hypothetical protein